MRKYGKEVANVLKVGSNLSLNILTAGYRDKNTKLIANAESTFGEKLKAKYKKSFWKNHTKCAKKK